MAKNDDIKKSQKLTPGRRPKTPAAQGFSGTFGGGKWYKKVHIKKGAKNRT